MDITPEVVTPDGIKLDATKAHYRRLQQQQKTNDKKKRVGNNASLSTVLPYGE